MVTYLGERNRKIRSSRSAARGDLVSNKMRRGWGGGKEVSKYENAGRTG